MKTIIEMNGWYAQGQEQVLFSIVIYEPEKRQATGDYYCRVVSPQLFGKMVKIYGVTPKQAIRLALETSKSLLSHLISAPFGDELPTPSKGKKKGEKER